MNKKCKEGSPAAILMKGHQKVSNTSKETRAEKAATEHANHMKPIKRAAGGVGKERKGYPFT